MSRFGFYNTYQSLEFHPKMDGTIKKPVKEDRIYISSGRSCRVSRRGFYQYILTEQRVVKSHPTTGYGSVRWYPYKVLMHDQPVSATCELLFWHPSTFTPLSTALWMKYLLPSEHIESNTSRRRSKKSNRYLLSTAVEIVRFTFRNKKKGCPSRQRRAAWRYFLIKMTNYSSIGYPLLAHSVNPPFILTAFT
jgi:hypothetical protein